MSDPGAVDASTAEKASVWEDFIDILYAPSAVYERRRNAGYWVPLIVVTLLVGIVFVAGRGVMQPILDAEFERGMAATMRANPQMTPEMLEQGRRIGGVIASIAAFIGMPISIFATGIVLWLSSKLVDAGQPLRSALLVSAYAFVPRVIGAVAGSVQGMLMDPSSLDGFFRLSIGPARFLDPDTASPMLLAVLSRFDLFVLWTTLLLAIGLAVVARIPRSKALVPAIIVWVAGALPALWGAVGQSR